MQNWYINKCIWFSVVFLYRVNKTLLCEILCFYLTSWELNEFPSPNNKKYITWPNRIYSLEIIYFKKWYQLHLSLLNNITPLNQVNVDNPTNRYIKWDELIHKYTSKSILLKSIMYYYSYGFVFCRCWISELKKINLSWFMDSFNIRLNATYR